jgi:hypothetical protein
LGKKVETFKRRLNIAERLTRPQSGPRPKPPESVTDTPPECPLAGLSAFDRGADSQADSAISVPDLIDLYFNFRELLEQHRTLIPALFAWKHPHLEQ